MIENYETQTNYAKEHSELGHESHSSCVVTKPSNFHAQPFDKSRKHTGWTANSCESRLTRIDG